jgi:hypothetical protein
MDASCEPLQKLLSRSPLSRRLSGSATTVSRIIMATRHYTMQVGNPYRPPMKHPVRSDFHSAVTEAGVSVTFKPTNSIYCFYRVTDTNDIARLGPVSFAGVQHAGRNTEDYPSDEVQDMAQRIASDFTTSVCFQERHPLAGVRNAITGNTARPISLASVRHAGSSSNTKAQRIASEVAATLRLIQNLDRPD